MLLRARAAVARGWVLVPPPPALVGRPLHRLPLHRAPCGAVAMRQRIRGLGTFSRGWVLVPPRRGPGAAVRRGCTGAPARSRGLMERHPLGTAIIISTVKTSIADLIVQTQIEGRTTVDWRRNALFAAFGCVYLGWGMHRLYCITFPRLFPGVGRFCELPLRQKLRDRAGLAALLKQNALDLFVVNPLLYYPCFYSFKAVFFGDDEALLPARVRTALLDHYPDTFLEDNFGMGFFWAPANLIIFSVPMHLRIPVCTAFSLGWCCILSFFRGSPTRPPTAE